MKFFSKIVKSGVSLALLATFVLSMSGCGPLDGSNNPAPNANFPAGNKTNDILNPGDVVTVIFSDLPPPAPAPFEEQIKNDGTITLLLNQTFQAANKTRGDLEHEIRERYVPRFYVNLTVTVVPQGRFYYVNGEVKNPSRQQHPGDMTVIKAIATAQGLTDFANHGKIRLTHANGQTVIINYDDALENSKLDLPVYPGDTITVPRHW